MYALSRELRYADQAETDTPLGCCNGLTLEHLNSVRTLR